MPVLIEAISVVVQVSAIHSRYPGGWDAFVAAAPNATLCADNEIARIGFMAPGDAKSFVNHLEQNGLVFLREGAAQDLAVVDQHRGLAVTCDWLDFGHIPLDEGMDRLVAACRLRGSSEPMLMHPTGWEYEGSLSQNSGFRSLNEVAAHLEYLGTEDGVDVYRDKNTGEKLYLGRTDE